MGLRAIEESSVGKFLTFSDSEIERRKAYVDLNDSDLKEISAIKEIVIKHSDTLTRQFFEVLMQLPENKSVFTSKVLLEELRTLKKEHLIAMVGGTYGQDYADQRVKLARLYSRAGLDTKIFLGAFHLLMRSLGNRLMEEFKGTPAQAFSSFLAIKKVAFFDLGIMVDVIMHERERTIRQQQEAIRELSTPVLQLRNRLLMLPIVGMLDTYRARMLTENLLRSIRENRAKVVVIDITGVAAVDSKVANHLVQTVAASKLMGAKVIITGLSAEIAQTLVTLGVELSKLNTVGDLQGGIEEAERLLGFKVAQEQMPATAGF